MTTPADALPREGPGNLELRIRAESELRATLSMLCNYIWTKQLRPGEHMWSIPVDKERDFDCILSDAIDELIEHRKASASLARLREALETLIMKWRANADMLGEGYKGEHYDPSVGMQRSCADELAALLTSLPAREDELSRGGA